MKAIERCNQFRRWQPRKPAVFPSAGYCIKQKRRIRIAWHSQWVCQEEAGCPDRERLEEESDEGE